MPPVLCPERLRKFIERVNREGGDEAHVFREILRTIQRRRQNKTGQETYVAKLHSTITVNLTDYSSHIRNELADALAEIDPPNLIERIRECPVAHCGHLFWAGRDDKKACNNHGGRVRKANNRRDIKQRKSVAAAKRRTEAARTTLGEMSPTAVLVIRAMMTKERSRLFWEIDWWAAYFCRDLGETIRSTRVVRLTINKLVKDGYLEYSESANPEEDRYDPTQKLMDLWNDSRLRTEQQILIEHYPHSE